MISCSSSLYNQYIGYCKRKTYAISINDVKDLVKDAPGKLKDVFNFIKELSKEFKGKIDNLINLFKNKPLFEFVKEFGFNLKKLFDYISSVPSKLLNPLIEEITKYVDKTGVVTWTTKELEKLDNWLNKRPLIKKASGIALAALVIYINMNVTYYGDTEADFDMSDFANALAGDFSLASIFGGSAGVKLFTLFLTNLAGLSVPWSGYKQFIAIFVGCLTALYKKFIKTYSDTYSYINTPRIRKSFSSLLDTLGYKGWTPVFETV